MLGVIHVIPAIPACPVRPKSGHSANARVYECTPYGAAVNQDAPPALGPTWLGDSTLVAWYRSLYAPHAGGAYDSHHRTAGIAGRTRRRGRMAARGARSRRDAGNRRRPLLG